MVIIYGFILVYCLESTVSVAYYNSHNKVIQVSHPSSYLLNNNNIKHGVIVTLHFIRLINTIIAEMLLL